jgi:hypothetical protein
VRGFREALADALLTESYQPLESRHRLGTVEPRLRYRRTKDFDCLVARLLRHLHFQLRDSNVVAERVAQPDVSAIRLLHRFLCELDAFG